MITIKNEKEISHIRSTGSRLAEIFEEVSERLAPGITTLEIDSWIEDRLDGLKLVPCSKGYCGYQHSSCVSINHELVHGVPSSQKRLQLGDLVKIDVCAACSLNGWCADMARSYIVGLLGAVDERTQTDSFASAVHLAQVAWMSLQRGVEQMVPGRRLGDVSNAIQREIESAGYGVVRDFCGHGIGRKMHEEPDVPNFGRRGQGVLLREGMVFALEPMLTAGGFHITVASDGWTAFTSDKSLAAHVEDTVVITKAGPELVTRRR
ncbi:MAG: type I methionyl aminopeptidase [Candidatus Babeliaceae bacterium]|nr:type I methionyl aminopeptidase [Candidatus Babeliaceae bacterium]